MMSRRRVAHGRRRTAVVEPSDEKIDKSLEETFPASDPPSWTPLARIGSPRRRRQVTSNKRRIYPPSTLGE